MYFILQIILGMALVQISHALATRTSHSLQAQPRSVAPTTVTKTCRNNCSYVGPEAISYGWQKGNQIWTATITAGIVQVLIDDRANTTSTTTNFVKLPSGYALPPMNAAGTRTTEITVGGTLTTLTYPTTIHDYGSRYYWSGTVLLNQSSPVVCATASSGSTVTLRSHPPLPVGTSFVADPQDPGGINYLLDFDSVHGGFYNPELFPELSQFHDCRRIGVSPAEVLQTASFLFETQTRTVIHSESTMKKSDTIISTVGSPPDPLSSTAKSTVKPTLARVSTTNPLPVPVAKSTTQQNSDISIQSINHVQSPSANPQEISTVSIKETPVSITQISSSVPTIRHYESESRPTSRLEGSVISSTSPGTVRNPVSSPPISTSTLEDAASHSSTVTTGTPKITVGRDTYVPVPTVLSLVTASLGPVHDATPSSKSTPSALIGIPPLTFPTSNTTKASLSASITRSSIPESAIAYAALYLHTASGIAEGSPTGPSSASPVDKNSHTDPGITTGLLTTFALSTLQDSDVPTQPTQLRGGPSQTGSITESHYPTTRQPTSMPLSESIYSLSKTGGFEVSVAKTPSQMSLTSNLMANLPGTFALSEFAAGIPIGVTAVASGLATGDTRTSVSSRSITTATTTVNIGDLIAIGLGYDPRPDQTTIVAPTSAATTSTVTTHTATRSNVRSERQTSVPSDARLLVTSFPIINMSSSSIASTPDKNTQSGTAKEATSSPMPIASSGTVIGGATISRPTSPNSAVPTSDVSSSSGRSGAGKRYILFSFELLFLCMPLYL